MPGETTISWTDRTWNPTTGCTHVSPGCLHCYAEALSLRFGRSQHPWTKPYEVENVQLHPDRLIIPHKWKASSRIFVDSMSDLFHNLVPDAFIDQVFAMMAHCYWHTFQVLTKRPERMAAYINHPDRQRLIGDQVGEMLERFPKMPAMFTIMDWPLPNVWLGTSVEDQRRSEERIPHLLDTPAAVRFLSCEPLLGPLDLTKWMPAGPVRWQCWGCRQFFAGPLQTTCPTCGQTGAWCGSHRGNGRPNEQPLGWIITGGESGPEIRPAEVQWFRDIRDQCLDAGVAYFHKQGSHRFPGRDRELDGVIWEQMPKEQSHG